MSQWGVFVLGDKAPHMGAKAPEQARRRPDHFTLRFSAEVFPRLVTSS
jgi:hypothetical protein